MVKKRSFLVSESEKTEIQEHSRETRLMKPQTDRAWVAHAGKPWEGVDVARYADTSNE